MHLGDVGQQPNEEIVIENRIYKLYLPLGTKALLIWVVLGFLGMTVLMFILPFITTGANAPPAFIGFIPLALLGWNLVWFLRFPYEIALHNDGSIDFNSVIRKVRMHATEIQSIKPANGTFGFLVVTGKKNVRLLAQFDDFHEFVSKLKQYNPSVITRGC